MRKRILFAVFALTALASVARAEELRVVTTLSTFADLVRQIGGQRVRVESVAPPTFNPHFIEPRPSDVLRVKRAELFIHAGLDLELWRGPLLDAAGNMNVRPGGKGELDLSRGIALLGIPPAGSTRAQGDIHLSGNPHYWAGPQNGSSIIKAIEAKLLELDPAGAEIFRANAAKLQTALAAKILIWEAAMSPFSGRELVGYHDEWPYLMSFLSLKMDLFLEPKPGIPPSPQHLFEVSEQIKSRKIPGIAQASFYSKDGAEAVAEKTGASVLILCQNVGEQSQCGDYLSMFDFNVSQILKAFGK